MILIGTPCYTGTVTIPYLRSLLALLACCKQADIAVELHHLAGESLLPRARNTIANAFLRQQDYSHLLLIDPDIGFPADAALRYLRANKDVICGIHPLPRLRRDAVPAAPALAALSYPFEPAPDALADDDGLLPVPYGPAGFMMIKRQVLRRLAQAHPELRYGHAYVDSGDLPYKKWAFFNPAIDRETRQYLPGDVAFCRRWTALGGTVYADVSSRFTKSAPCALTGQASARLQDGTT